MAGDAGLSHAEDFLDLRDRQFFALEEVKQPEARGIGQKPQRFYY
jgi:hypothetical protein